MDGAKAETATKKAEPILPKPSVPKKVLESNATSTAPPAKKEVAPASSELLDKKERVYPDEKPVGTIVVSVYRNKPYEAKFTGHIAGFEMNIAIPAIRKQYKLWKRNLIKTGGK